PADRLSGRRADRAAPARRHGTGPQRGPRSCAADRRRARAAGLPLRRARLRTRPGVLPARRPGRAAAAARRRRARARLRAGGARAGAAAAAAGALLRIDGFDSSRLLELRLLEEPELDG